MAAPRMGHIGHSLEKVAAADSGFLVVPLKVLGNPPSGWSSPLLGFFGDFRGWTLRSCWAACCLPAPLALGIRKGWYRRLEPLFSSWLGPYTVSFAPALHSSLGPHSKGPVGHVGG